MAHTLNILHIAPVLSQGGAERLLHMLASRNNSNEKHIIALMMPGNHFGEENLELVQLGFERGKPIRSLLNLWPAIKQLRALIVDEKIDVVQGWLYYGNLLSLVACQLQKPIIWSVHNSTLLPWWKKPHLAFSNWAMAFASWSAPARIVYCAHSARVIHEAQGYAAAPGLVIENGVDLYRFQPAHETKTATREGWGLPADDFIVGLFGRNNPQKNIPACLAAFALFAKTLPNARLVLAGSDMDAGNARLEKLIASHELTAKVTCLGAVTDVPAAINGVDMVMLGSSYGEAMPMVLLEALACERRIVSTNIGDIAELPVPTYALVPPDDPAALAEAMGRVARADPLSPEWQTGFAKLRNTYCIERYCEAHSALYRELT